MRFRASGESGSSSLYLARIVKHVGILAFRMECPTIHFDIFGVGEHAHIALDKGREAGKAKELLEKWTEEEKRELAERDMSNNKRRDLKFGSAFICPM
jgi:hypothetical protein